RGSAPLFLGTFVDNGSLMEGKKLVVVGITFGAGFGTASATVCKTPKSTTFSSVRARGLVAYHALWIVDCVKLQRILPMDGYILDPNYPDEALDIVLSSPKRRPRPLGPDSSFSSSVYTPSSTRKLFHPRFSTSPLQDPDFSIDHDLDLGDVFSTPGRLSHSARDLDDSSSLSWDLTPSLTFELEADIDDEMDSSRVEELVDTEMGEVGEGGGINWSEMGTNSSNSILQTSGTPELDANLVLEKLSEQYLHVLVGTTTFKPHAHHDGKMFSAVRTRPRKAY
ncbi:hypothetical protein FRC08_001283, partial [Ceratobasidium sp. 394]